MHLITKALYAVGFTSLFGCSFIYTGLDVELSIGDVIAACSFVIVVPFLLQILVGLAVGAIASRFGRTSQPSPEEAQSSGRLAIRSMVVLIVLVAIPAVVVEGVLRWRVDAPIARLAEGSEAFIDIVNPWEVSDVIPPGSPILLLDKAKVRIEEDRAMSEIEGLKDGWITAIRDYRTVKVKVLDGPMAGEAAYMNYYMLRPIR
jgi:hypothetical protein